MHSFSQRLLISVSLLLLLFFGVMVAVLDGRFRAVSENALRDLLDAQMVALIASADPDDGGNVVPRLPDAESRLTTPGSGLYAAVSSDAGELFWRSPSAVGSLQEFGPPQEPGARDFRYLTDSHGQRLAAVSRGLRWEDDDGRIRDLTFTVATDLSSYERQLQDFRRGLLGGFGVLAALLLLTLAALLRWALAPLRRLASQIREVEEAARAARRPLAQRTGGCDAQSQRAARGRTRAHRALSRHARQPGPQPEDAAGRDAHGQQQRERA
jgi:two-component system sensor histidine kinase PhoQ